MPDAAVIAQRVVGHRPPPGEFTIDAQAARSVWRLHGREASSAHPVFACVASLRAMGISISGLCELCDFDLADGPLLGECDVEIDTPLQVGQRYLVSSIIESFERVPSRSFGRLDRLRFLVTLATVATGPVARVRYLWLLPRRGAAA